MNATITNGRGREGKLTEKARTSSVWSGSTPLKQVAMAVMEQVFAIPAPEDARNERTAHVQVYLTLFTLIERARSHVATPGAYDVFRFLIVLVQTKFQRMIRMEIVPDLLRKLRATFTETEIARATCQLDKVIFVANAANPVDGDLG
jgi:hypothetical protein